MKVLLAIPSFNRPYEIEKKCGFWLKKLEGIDWKLFVRDEQYLYYAQSIPEDHLVSINVNSFRETINAIGKYAIDNKYDLVHKVDDDMSFKKLGKAKKTDCHEVYVESYNEIIKRFFEDPELFGLSISKPMHHIRNKGTLWTRQNKAMYGNQFLRSQIMNLPEGVELFDDIYFTLLIHKLGKKTLTYSGAYEDSIMLKNAGGLQSINRNKLSSETIAIMQTMFLNVKIGNYKGNEDVIDIDLKSLNIK